MNKFIVVLAGGVEAGPFWDADSALAFANEQDGVEKIVVKPVHEEDWDLD